jgi:3-oxoacyl-[acyl-carrier protein] reductase
MSGAATVTGELAGRVALVTGAARNIGRAIARELAAAGASVVVNARSSKAALDTVAAEIVAEGGQALTMLADVTDRAAVESMVEAARATFGRIDILVNNAAVRAEAPLEAIDYAAWRRVLDVTLDGAFFCVQACLADLRASGAGRIVNIGGLTGHTGTARRLHVVTAKAGLAGFTRALAHDLGPDGVTVNCVAPGLIETERSTSSGTAEHRRQRATLVPNAGMPEDVARMVRHLCGPAGRFITGQTIHVNGGTHLG